jgi:hypothetical protein
MHVLNLKKQDIHGFSTNVSDVSVTHLVDRVNPLSASTLLLSFHKQICLIFCNFSISFPEPAILWKEREAMG